MTGPAHRARQIEPSWLGRLRPAARDGRGQPGATCARWPGGRRRPAGCGCSARSTPRWRADDPFGGEVPDPYGGRPDDYALAFDLIQAAARGLGRAARGVAATRSPRGRERAGGRRRQRPAGPADRDRGARSCARSAAQHRWRHYRVILADGRAVFAKAAAADLGRGLRAPRPAGWRWLAEAERRRRCPRCSAGTRPCWSSPGCPTGQPDAVAARAVRPRTGPAARGRRGPVRGTVAGVHRQPAAARRGSARGRG